MSGFIVGFVAGLFVGIVGIFAAIHAIANGEWGTK